MTAKIKKPVWGVELVCVVQSPQRIDYEVWVRPWKKGKTPLFATHPRLQAFVARDPNLHNRLAGIIEVEANPRKKQLDAQFGSDFLLRDHQISFFVELLMEKDLLKRFFGYKIQPPSAGYNYRTRLLQNAGLDPLAPIPLAKDIWFLRNQVAGVVWGINTEKFKDQYAKQHRARFQKSENVAKRKRVQALLKSAKRKAK